MTQLPTLDDRTFAELVADARALIPSLLPSWTDHNPSDPGIVLVELFAWLAEIVLYRIDRVPERTYRTFLQLLRGAQPTAPDGSALLLGDAIRTTIAGLRERRRAVTADDVEHLALRRWPTLANAAALGVPGVVRRARCIAEQSVATLPLAWQSPAPAAAQGHFTLVVVPDCLAASMRDLQAFDASRHHALELDGAAGHVACGNDASLAITSALTLSAWIFPRDLTRGRQGIVTKSARGEFEFYVEPDGSLGFRQADGIAGGTSSARLAAGRWSHVAVVRDAGALTFYLDGAPAGTAALAQPAIATTEPVVIGRLSSGTGFFNGFVRDVCVWSRPRSAIELAGDRQRIPAASGATATPAPIACWRLDEIAAQVGGTGPVVTPDAMTPAGAAPRLRDGVPNAALWRDVLRPLELQPPLRDGLLALIEDGRLLTTRVEVTGYRALRVRVSAKIYLRSDGVARDVLAAARRALDRFLDPLRGGPGSGWPFGRPIFTSDLGAVLDDIPGTDFVESVMVDIVGDSDPSRQPGPFDEDNQRIGVRLQPDELPVLDSVAATIYQRRGTQWAEV